MHRSGAAAMALAGLVLLAGCSALIPGGGGGEGRLVWETAVPTGTPVPTAAVGASPDEGRSLYEGPEDLTERHHRRLTNGSYRVEATVAVFHNDTRIGRQRVVLDSDGDRVHYRSTVDGTLPVAVWRTRGVGPNDRPAAEYDVFANGSRVWTRVVGSNGTRVNRIYQSGLRRFVYADAVSLSHASQRARLLTLLHSVPNGSMRAQIVGEDVFTVVLSADELTRQPEFAGGTLVELEELTLVVRSSGLITEARFVYHVRVDGTVYRVIELIEFSKPAEVERPAWVPANGTATGGGTP